MTETPRDEEIARRLLEQSRREPVLLVEETVVCPACGKRSLVIREYLYEVPYFGKIVLGEGRCSNCGYHYSDVRVAEASEPKKIIVKVHGEKQLRYLLVKSATAAILIPEKGYEMVPGPASMGFISTVEGVLHRFLEVLEVACSGREEDQACLENRRWLERAIEGLERFTLVICDFEGTSRVVGDDVAEEPIDEECRRLHEKSMLWSAASGR
ncbi:MAG: ZPR1 zinc finger domain-containing protein [Desulfurococcales archaeon]|nr:ZPR1 zinc finger domain-containing protein [Desulfurococcales archaeon]